MKILDGFEVGGWGVVSMDVDIEEIGKLGLYCRYFLFYWFEYKIFGVYSNLVEYICMIF